jgi:hypothetical protein
MIRNVCTPDDKYFILRVIYVLTYAVLLDDSAIIILGYSVTHEDHSSWEVELLIRLSRCTTSA